MRTLYPFHAEPPSCSFSSTRVCREGSIRPPCDGVLLMRLYHRGSSFLKKWMRFLEDNADLRYPDLSMVTQEG